MLKPDEISSGFFYSLIFILFYAMVIKAESVTEYISKVPEERQPVFKKLRKVIKANLPKGFKECINYNMIGYVVPHKLYPDGYHCDPKLPLPFINIGNQKGYVALYHSGVYAEKKVHDWFVKEYPKHAKYKLDMGKSCIRFKRLDDIPYELIGELMTKYTVDDWIKTYEKNIKKK